jgi:hypothetical protein
MFYFLLWYIGCSHPDLHRFDMFGLNLPLAAILAGAADISCGQLILFSVYHFNFC